MALLSPPCACPSVSAPGLRFSSPLRPGLPLCGCFSTSRKLGSGEQGKGALGAGTTRSPLRVWELFRWVVHGLFPWRRFWRVDSHTQTFVIQQVFIECLLCAAAGYSSEQKRYSCPRGASGLAYRRTRTGTHLRGTPRHPDTNSLLASSSHTTRPSQAPGRPTGALRDPRDLETQDYDYGSAHKQVTHDL